MRNAAKDTVASQQPAAFTDKVNYGGGVIESINLKNDRNGAPTAHQHRNSLQQQQQQLQKRPSVVKGGPGGGRGTARHVSTSSEATDTSGSSCSDGDTTSSSYDEPNLPYPGFTEYSLKYLTQDSKPRIWCLQLITNPYPFQIASKSPILPPPFQCPPSNGGSLLKGAFYR